MPQPLFCPEEDWEAEPSDSTGEQLAGFIEHFEAKHAEQLPQPTREVLKACAKEVREKIPV